MSLSNFDNALPVVFQQLFEARLSQGGVRINNLINNIQFQGPVYFIRQFDGPDIAEEYTGDGNPIQTDTIAFWRRRLMPKKFKYGPIVMSEFDKAITGGFDIGMLSLKAADGCSLALDKLVINALTADVYCDNDKTIPFPKQNIIPYTFPDAGSPTTLTAKKVLEAVQKVRTNGVMGNIVCFANYAHLTDFNLQPAMATGITNPYGGVNGFVPTLFTNTTTSVVGDDHIVDYVYIVATDYIFLGSCLPWTMQTGQTVGWEQGYRMIGMYDCVRKEEAAVVVIEVDHIDANPLPKRAATKATKK
jgi:hypothetical protein